MKRTKNIAVFCDFDGTISTKDIGDEIFVKFGEFEPLHSRLVNGEISIKEYWHLAFANMNQGISGQDIAQFAIDTFDIDPYFVDFYRFCQDNKIEVYVVSDGYEEYILPILEKNGLCEVKVFANYLQEKDTNLVPVFKYASQSCNCMCASCKRNTVANYTKEEFVSVYIGDGYSDYCAARHSDAIFAKKALESWLSRNKVPHYSFGTFFDVKRLLAKILKEGGVKPRNEAKVLRNLAFRNE